jgi:hypothetical protein
MNALVTYGDTMAPTNADIMKALDALGVRMDAYERDQQAGQETVATPAPVGAHVVAFANPETEAIAQAVYGCVLAHPAYTVAQIVQELGLPTHWFRNPKMLANGQKLTPSLAIMRERAGAAPTATPATSKPAKPEATPAEAQARRAVAIRVAEHLEHALDDGLASGLLHEKAKSTATLRNMAAQVRIRGGV